MGAQTRLALDDPAVFGPWIRTHDCDAAGRALADRHYSRQTKGAARFTRPGKNLVLITEKHDAVWASWYNSPYRRDKLNCYECTIFRNESNHLSSYLIGYACLATFNEFGSIKDGIITYVDEKKVGSKNAGFCFESVGFKRIGRTKKNNLIIYQLKEEDLIQYISCIETNKEYEKQFESLSQCAVELAYEEDFDDAIDMYTKALSLEHSLNELYQYARRTLGIKILQDEELFEFAPCLEDFLMWIYGERGFSFEEAEHWEKRIIEHAKRTGLELESLR